MKREKKQKKGLDILKIYFIVIVVLILIFLIIFLVPNLSSKEISLQNALKKVFGEDVTIYETKVVSLPNKPDTSATFDTILNSKGTIIGKYCVTYFSNLLLKNSDNKIKLLISFNPDGKIKKIISLNTIKTEKQTNWDEFFDKFVNKDYKDLLNNPISLPLENSELAMSLKDKIQEICSLSYIMDYGEEAYLRLNPEQREYKRLVVGDKIPKFETVDIDGNKISNETIKGKNTIIVSTNATCGSCIEHTHEFDELVSKVGKGKHFNYIFISETNKEKTVKEYLETSPNKKILKIVIDQGQEILRLLSMDFTPDVIFVDPEGIILFHNPPTTKDIEKKLIEFLK